MIYCRLLLMVLCTLCTLTYSSTDPQNSQNDTASQYSDNDDINDSVLICHLKKLDDFAAIDSFEKYVNHFADSGVKFVPASKQDTITITPSKYFITKIWQRETGINHARLYKSLDNNGRKLLEEADSAWNIMTVTTEAFLYQILGTIYCDSNCGSSGGSCGLLRRGHSCLYLSINCMQ